MGRENEIPRRCRNNWEIGETLINLEERDQVIFPTDNTNSFRSVDTKKIYDYGE